jgi:radical SAM-linked protein
MTQRSSEKAQRIRISFARGPEATAIGHLDASRRWEDAFHQAGIALSYTQGNRPTPRITLAAGLAAGVTSDGELLDVILAQLTDPSTLVERLQPHLPAGIHALDAREVGVGTPSLPTLARWADYEVDVRTDDLDALRARVDTLLASEGLPWVDTRGEKRREYDLRALVQDVRVEPLCEADSRPRERAARLTMRLRSDDQGVGRPDQVVRALALEEPARIHRLRLIISETSRAHDAWRRRGRYLI